MRSFMRILSAAMAAVLLSLSLLGTLTSCSDKEKGDGGKNKPTPVTVDASLRDGTLDSYALPLSSIVSSDGAITSYFADDDPSQNKYMTDSVNKVAFIDLSGCAFDEIVFGGNDAKSLGFTFLTKLPKLGEKVSYALGYHGVYVSSRGAGESSLPIAIPSDAKILAVTFASAGEGGAVVSTLPSAITFAKKSVPDAPSTGEGEPLENLRDPLLRRYEYPMDKVTSSGATILGDNGRYEVVGSGKYAVSLIDLTGTTFDTVTLVQNENGNELGYGFLTSAPTLNELAPFCEGYTNLVWAEEDDVEVELSIPATAKYLVVYYQDWDYSAKAPILFVPSEIVFTKKAPAPELGLLDSTLSGFAHPTSGIFAAAGTIAYDLPNGSLNRNRYIESSGDRVAFINIADTVFDTVTLTAAPGQEIAWSFLSAMPSLGEKVSYAGDYVGFSTVSGGVTEPIGIPSNAKFLVVLYQKELPSGEIAGCCPVGLGFEKLSGKGALVNMQSNTLAEYSYPMSELTILDGSIAKQSGLYLVSSTGMVGALVDLAECAFDSVTLTKNASGRELGYAFLSAAPVADFVPTYAAGYTEVVYTESETVTLRLPENARYLYVTYRNGDALYLPASLKFTKSGETPSVNANSVRLATWNIGHFSMGVHTYSKVGTADYTAKLEAYKNYLGAIDADVITLNEYSANFTDPSKNSAATSLTLAKTTVFSDYPIAFEGSQSRYSCNAIYAKAGLTNIEQHVFECNKNATITHTNAIKASDYYYITADLNVGGVTVKIVTAHLAFDEKKNPDTVNINQMKELIEYCKNYDRVVLMGDWNVGSFSYFDTFVNAGYQLACTKSNLPTYVGNTRCIDNIIYKGVTVSDFTLAGTNLSDHYGIYCTVTVEN